MAVVVVVVVGVVFSRFLLSHNHRRAILWT